MFCHFTYSVSFPNAEEQNKTLTQTFINKLMIFQSTYGWFRFTNETQKSFSISLNLKSDARVILKSMPCVTNQLGIHNKFSRVFFSFSSRQTQYEFDLRDSDTHHFWAMLNFLKQKLFSFFMALNIMLLCQFVVATGFYNRILFQSRSCQESYYFCLL